MQGFARVPAVGARPATRHGAAPSKALPLPIHPAFRRMPAPVVIIGTGRSGTSLASAMLTRLGVFMGAELERADTISAITRNTALRSSGYGEAGPFFRMNELLLRRAGTSWDRPAPFLHRREEARARHADLELLRLGTYGSIRTEYLAAYRRSGMGNWGWKDPRNSLTLPYWLNLFPDARVLHVRRDPRAVAESLHTRAVKWRDEAANGTPKAVPGRLAEALLNPGRAARAVLRRAVGAHAPAGPDPCLDWDYCFNLGEDYLRECVQYRSLGTRYLELRYEEMVADPEGGAEQLARFMDVDWDYALLARAAALVSQDRSGYTSGSSLPERLTPCPRLATRALSEQNLPTRP